MRVSQDAAEQRAGRTGRVADGRCYRLITKVRLLVWIRPLPWGHTRIMQRPSGIFALGRGQGGQAFCLQGR